MIAPVNRPLSSGFPAGSPMYWVVYKEIYLERLEIRFPGSEHPLQTRRVLDRFTRYANLTGALLTDVSALHLESYLAKRRDDEWRNKPLCARTINNELNMLNACLAHAGPREPRGPGRKYLGYLASPPFVELLREEIVDPVVLDESALRRFLDAARSARTPRLEGCDPERFWLAVLVLVGLTALRRKSLLRIPRPDEHTLRELREIVLPAKLSKVRREQRISLGRRDDVVDLFAGLPTKVGEPLLPWRTPAGQPMTLAHFNHAMKDLQRSAGIEAEECITTKEMRSTVATEVLDLFGDAVAKKRLGHAPGSTTIDRHYKGRRPTERDRDASDHLAGMIFRAAGGGAGPTEPALRVVTEAS